MPISTKLFNEQAIRGIARLSEQANTFQEQIATGKKDLRPSQDPVSAARLSSIKEIEADLRRFTDNLGVAKTRLGLADQVLGSIQSILIRANELAIQGANATNSETDRQAIRAEIDQLRESLIGLANTVDDRGQALFGGYVMRESPFIQEKSGAVRYEGDSGQTTVLASDRLMILTGISGADAFMRVASDDGPVSIFSIFSGLSAALDTADQATAAARVLADADQGIGAAIGQLRSGIEHIGLQRARIGAQYNAADIQSEALARKELLLAETRSGIEDADIAEVISKLQSLLVNRDAAQQVFAKLSQQSLFDYLR